MHESSSGAARRSERERSIAAGASGISRLPDPWSRQGSLPLDGRLERGSGLPPWVLALMVLAGAFIAFQVAGAVVSGLLIGLRGMQTGAFGAEMDPATIQDLITTSDLIIGNSVGQVLGLALPALGMAWLHSSWVGGFLRVRTPSWTAVGLSLVGMAALTPVVGWLTELNQLVPLPDVLRALEETRMEVIRQVLESDLGLWANLLGLAVVPALCEELIFRGYAQRQFERSTGAAWGIALSGILFGFYHLSLAQVLPLSVLGVYLAYLTWRTGSLWPAILVHFANNAFAVVSAEMATSRSDVSLAEVETTSWPWYAVAGGLILFAAVLFLLHTRASRRRPARANNEDE